MLAKTPIAALALLTLVLGSCAYLGLSGSTRTGIVRGIVVDQYTLTALTGAEVRLDGTKLIATTDSTGRFTFESAPTGTRKLRVSHTGHLAQSVERVPVSADSAMCTIAMLRGTSPPSTTAVEAAASATGRPLPYVVVNGEEAAPLSLRSLPIDIFIKNLDVRLANAAMAIYGQKAANGAIIIDISPIVRCSGAMATPP